MLSMSENGKHRTVVAICYSSDMADLTFATVLTLTRKSRWIER